jgi:hypothetical protein
VRLLGGCRGQFDFVQPMTIIRFAIGEPGQYEVVFIGAASNSSSGEYNNGH